MRDALTAHADRLRLAAGLIEDATRPEVSDVRSMLILQRAALIAGDVNSQLYEIIRQALGVQA